MRSLYTTTVVKTCLKISICSHARREGEREKFSRTRTTSGGPAIAHKIFLLYVRQSPPLSSSWRMMAGCFNRNEVVRGPRENGFPGLAVALDGPVCSWCSRYIQLDPRPIPTYFRDVWCRFRRFSASFSRSRGSINNIMRSFRVLAPQTWNMQLSHFKDINVNREQFKSGLGSLCKTTHRWRLWKQFKQRHTNVRQSLGHRHSYAIEVSRLADLGYGIICRLNFDNETYAWASLGNF